MWLSFNTLPPTRLFSPALATRLLSSLLPPGLLSRGDRATRVRSLHLLRTLTEALGAAGIQAGSASGEGGGALKDTVLGCWSTTEWSSVSELLHVLVRKTQGVGGLSTRQTPETYEKEIRARRHS